MKHLESVLFAAALGAVVFYLLNQQTEKITPKDSDAIKYGAVIGAATQIVLRFTGVS